MNVETGSLLVAKPSLDVVQDYERSVVMICNKTPECSVGVFLNNLTTINTLDRLCRSNRMLFPENGFNLPVYTGGPFHKEYFAALHSTDYKAPHSRLVQADLFVTVLTTGVLEDIVHGRGPQKLRMCGGYVRWLDDMLAREIQVGYWAPLPYDPSLALDGDIENMWDKAREKAGIPMPPPRPVFSPHSMAVPSASQSYLMH